MQPIEPNIPRKPHVSTISEKKPKRYPNSLERTNTLMNKEPTTTTRHNTMHNKEATKEEDESREKRRNHRSRYLEDYMAK